MQLGKKSKTTDIYEIVRDDLGPQSEEAPLVNSAMTSSAQSMPEIPSSAAQTSMGDSPVRVTLAEAISARVTREGSLKSFKVKGDLQLRILDPAFTKVKIDLTTGPDGNVHFLTHPNVDKALFNSSKIIQLKNPIKGFPANNAVEVLRWNATAQEDENGVLPITFTVWVNRGAEGSYTVTVEYELTGGDSLKDVVVTIPFATSEPAVSSFDAVYEVSGDCLDWNIGTVDDDNPTGSFEFEGQAEQENEFFPMHVKFSKSKPFADIDVSRQSYLIFTRTYSG